MINSKTKSQRSKSKRNRRLSPSLLVSFVALFVALSGAAVALPGTETVNSGDIKDNSVKSVDLKDDQAVEGVDVVDETLASADVQNGTLTGADVAQRHASSKATWRRARSARTRSATTSTSTPTRSTCRAAAPRTATTTASR